MRKILLVALAVCIASATMAGEKKVLRFGLETSRTDSQYHGAQVMAKYVRDNTDGNVDIRLFPDSSLGSTVSMIAQVRSGTLDFTLSGSGNFAGMVEAMNVFDVPFLFKNNEHVDRVMDGPIGRTIMDECEGFDMKGLALWENGFRALTNSRNAARVPADVAGLKIRVPGMPMHVEAWKLLGTNPIPMNYSEVFTALETRTIDAQDHPIAICFSSRFYEMQKFMSVSRHAYTPLLLAMNLKTFQSLSPEYQKVMLEGAHLGAVAQRKFVRDNELDYINQIKAYGLEVLYPEDLDMKPWEELVMPGMIAFLQTLPKASKWLQPIQDAANK